MTLNINDFDTGFKSCPQLDQVVSIATSSDRRKQSHFVGSLNNSAFLQTLEQQAKTLDDEKAKNTTLRLLERVRIKLQVTFSNRIGRPQA